MREGRGGGFPCATVDSSRGVYYCTASRLYLHPPGSVPGSTGVARRSHSLPTHTWPLRLAGLRVLGTSDAGSRTQHMPSVRLLPCALVQLADMVGHAHLIEHLGRSEHPHMMCRHTLSSKVHTASIYVMSCTGGSMP